MKVLDTFTTLEAELEARRRQYQYYRDALLTFEEDTDAATRVRWITLDGIAINLDSQRRPLKKSVREAGEFAYYGASGIIDYVSDYIFDGDYLLVSEDGANLLARSTPIAFSISGKTWVNNHAHVLQFNSYIERRFVEIYLNSIDLSLYVSGAVQPKLNQANLNRIPIPIPPLEVQARIVAVLDQFDTLVNDITAGLPAEIAARRQQYAYYRDRLLTFKEAV
ncbi:restriction endonuclease subunit S [Xylella fastidiosa]|uniref:restriction endonuclease subunit S n=1 Tax=Xylella fastidiosa TaxID=2371 RepID=UPI001BAF62BC|nr:restriction endonuclease subunit S [Xylella fastidiosa]UIN28851.1 restriction endonuclease subunit S [Xylella fastidiosa subsp. morus]UIT43408.1 restriction endonuclease subunit S [Xylella fastidiosa subsp. morus]